MVANQINGVRIRGDRFLPRLQRAVFFFAVPPRARRLIPRLRDYKYFTATRLY
jgi:hypothetical protein